MKHNNNHEAALCMLMYISNAYLYLNGFLEWCHYNNFTFCGISCKPTCLAIKHP